MNVDVWAGLVGITAGYLISRATESGLAKPLTGGLAVAAGTFTAVCFRGRSKNAPFIAGGSYALGYVLADQQRQMALDMKQGV